MKKIFFIFAILILMFSKTSVANEVVGKGLICISDNPANKTPVGFFFFDEHQYELWIHNLSDFHSNAFFIDRSLTVDESIYENEYKYRLNAIEKNKVKFKLLERKFKYKLEDFRIRLESKRVVTNSDLFALGAYTIYLNRETLILSKDGNKEKTYNIKCFVSNNREQFLKDLDEQNKLFIHHFLKIAKKLKQKIDFAKKQKEERLKQRKF